MRITCDQCSTKYSIADDKVRGKMFKIRCKKCQHVIVVRNEGEGAAGEPTAAGDGGVFDNKETRVYNHAAYAKGAGAEGDVPDEADRAVWHVVVAGDQVGPLTVDQLQGKVTTGEVGASSYVWREGFSDWTELRQVPELSTLMVGIADAPPAAAPVREEREPDLFSAPVASKPPVTRAAPRAADAGEGAFFTGDRTINTNTRDPGNESDVFSPRVSGGGGAMAPAGPSLTGQRSENSVLFSLSNLAPMGAGGSNDAATRSASASPQRGGEGSGLIDIRAMAQTTLASVGAQPSSAGNASHPEELPMFGGSVFSPAPVLLPTVQPGMPKWVWGVMAAGGLLLLALAIMVITLFTREKPQVAATPSAPAAPHVDPKKRETQTAAKATPEGAKAADTAQPAPSRPEDSEAEKAKSAPKAAGSAAKPKPAKEKSETDVAAAPTKSAEPAPTKSKPTRGRDELDDLLSKAIGGGSVATPPPAAQKEEAAPVKQAKADEDLPDTLSPRDIQGGMSKVKSKVSACYAQFNVPGTVFLEVTIGSSGRIQNAVPTGKFAGTPTGDCVARAAKSASFPPFKGGAISIQYPFMLSK